MTAIDGHHVKSIDLDGRSSCGPPLEMRHAEFDEAVGRGALSATKRREPRRRTTTHPDTLNPSNSSRPSGLGVDMRFSPNADDREKPGENLGHQWYLLKPGEVRNADHENLRKDIWDKHGRKGPLPSLISPPASRGCSSWVSTASDARSEASVVQLPSSPRSNYEIEWDEINSDDHGLLRMPDLEGPTYVPVSYPQTLQLPDSPQSNPKRWSEPRSCWPDQDVLMADDNLMNQDSMLLQGQLYVTKKSVVDVVSQSEKDDPEVSNYEEPLNLADQMGVPRSPMVSNTITDGLPNDLTQILRQHDGDSSIWLTEEPHDPCFTIPSMPIAAFCTEELEQQNPEATVITQPASENEMLSITLVDSKPSSYMYINESNPGSIEKWSDRVPDNFGREPVDPHSPPTSILMTVAEEELEERVSRALYYDANLASILNSKLKRKLSFILPLFLDEEDWSPFGITDRYFYGGYERGGTPRTSTPYSTTNSGPSTSSKSNNATTAATPVTIADMSPREEDEFPQRPNKRPRRSKPHDPVNQGRERRRLRCHFHAKSPSAHQQKTCVMSGWRNIHNLEGPYSTHHTLIRCNKCFQKFDCKPPKNVHQKSCRADEPAPYLDVIDCDKTDEIKEGLKTLRDWRLETEQNEEMRSWISKYKAELTTNDLPMDDVHDSKELAKWYLMWRILFPNHRGQVPNPFQNNSFSPGDLTLERVLEMFQDMVDAKVENHQPPPSDLCQQIQYYKEIIRMIFRVIQPSPSSTPGAYTASSIPVDGRSISALADSSVIISSDLHGNVLSTPIPDPLREESSGGLGFPNDPTVRRQAMFAYSSSPNMVASNSSISGQLSRGSPCAAEKRAAAGRSSVTGRLQQRLSTQHTNTVSDYQTAVAAQERTSPIPQVPVFIQAQDGVGSGLAVQSGTTARGMLPPAFPPQRRQPVPSPALQNVPPPRSLPNQLNYPQSNQAQSADSPAGSDLSRFATVDPTTGYNFSAGESYQEAQSWSHDGMGAYTDLKCRNCHDTGFAFTESGIQQHCPCEA